jgi:hypothetical protein
MERSDGTVIDVSVNTSTVYDAQARPVMADGAPRHHREEAHGGEDPSG